MFLDIAPVNHINTPAIITFAIILVLAIGIICALLIRKKNVK